MTGHWHPGTMPDPIALDSGDVRIVKHFRANGNLPKPRTIAAACLDDLETMVKTYFSLMGLGGKSASDCARMLPNIRVRLDAVCRDGFPLFDPAKYQNIMRMLERMTRPA